MYVLRYSGGHNNRTKLCRKLFTGWSINMNYPLEEVLDRMSLKDI